MTFMASVNDQLLALEEHWAVSTFAAEQRAALANYRRRIFPGDDVELRWDLLLLRRNVELWSEVLSGSGPSGLNRAMELVATIREARGTRERELLASFDESEEMRMRFYLFA